MKPSVMHKGFDHAVGYDEVLGRVTHPNGLGTNEYTVGFSVVQRSDKTYQAAGYSAMQRSDKTNQVTGYSAMQRSDKAQQFGQNPNNHAAGYSTVQKRDKHQNFSLSANQYVAGSSDMQGRDKTKHNFRYSPLDKGKSKKSGGAEKNYVHGLSKSGSMPIEQISFFGLSEPIQIPKEPIFVFNISNPGENSLQSQPSNQITHTKDKPLSFTSP